MDADEIERRSRNLIADIVGCSTDKITSAGDLRAEVGLGSFDVLQLREGLERAFGVRLRDDDVRQLRRLDTLTELIAARLAADPSAVVVDAPVGALEEGASGGVRIRDGVLYADLEIGMPHLGRHNLAETPFLRELGHLRWKHVSALTGIPSKDTVDEDGARLYATFFWVEMVFPKARPMAAYRENDRLTVACTLERFGTSILDGRCWLFPASWPAERKVPPPEGPLSDEVPWVRLSNVFVKQWSGAGWLKTTRPADKAFERLREIFEPPDSYERAQAVKESGDLLDTPEGFEALSEGPVTFEQSLEPDRDLNGAGLVYFANYPLFLDLAERRYLRMGDLALPEVFIDKRTTVHRRSAYFGNAEADDTLVITARGFVENPWKTRPALGGMAPPRLLLHYRMTRKSDGRLMMVSSVEKTVTGETLGVTPLGKKLEERATS
jgi:probable biosynthetic protein (TIGR04098 family)